MRPCCACSCVACMHAHVHGARHGGMAGRGCYGVLRFNISLPLPLGVGPEHRFSLGAAPLNPAEMGNSLESKTCRPYGHLQIPTSKVTGYRIERKLSFFSIGFTQMGADLIRPGAAVPGSRTTPSAIRHAWIHAVAAGEASFELLLCGTSRLCQRVRHGACACVRV